MAGYTCPHCGSVMAVNSDTAKIRYASFEHDAGRGWNGSRYEIDSSTIELDFRKCPACEEISVYVTGRGTKVSSISTMLYPSSYAKKYPEYVPVQIRNDYEEACEILYQSPKASATLARRCLQGMIRDYWKVSAGTLNQEISALKDLIPADLWVAIDGVRRIGNIGAHMEKDTNVIIDIDPDEAHKLILLIELLIKEWYIAREERAKLFKDILQINSDKQSRR